MNDANHNIIDARRRTGISEQPGGAVHIDMSGGTYSGNSTGNPASLRFLNFVSVTDSSFHDMVITDVGSSYPPMTRITGSMVSFDNTQWDVNTAMAYDCRITVYHPTGENGPVLKSGDPSNILTVLGFVCTGPLPEWCMQAYCNHLSSP